MTGVRASAKPAAKKTSVKKAPVKKATAVKAPAEKGVAEKGVAEKDVAEKGVAEKGVAEKGVAEKGVAEKTLAEKTVAKTPAKKATKAVPAKKVAATKAPAKKAVAKEAPAKKAAPTNTASDGRLTATELRAIRVQLAREHDEMQAEYDQSVIALNDLQQTNSDGAGDDQADAGSKTFDREQEQSITANRQDLLRQIEHALERIDAGTYGLCENCGKPIPKARLQALPMATLDAACKVREERH